MENQNDISTKQASNNRQKKIRLIGLGILLVVFLITKWESQVAPDAEKLISLVEVIGLIIGLVFIYFGFKSPKKID